MLPPIDRRMASPIKGKEEGLNIWEQKLNNDSIVYVSIEIIEICYWHNINKYNLIFLQKDNIKKIMSLYGQLYKYIKN